MPEGPTSINSKQPAKTTRRRGDLNPFHPNAPAIKNPYSFWASWAARDPSESAFTAHPNPETRGRDGGTYQNELKPNHPNEGDSTSSLPRILVRFPCSARTMVADGCCIVLQHCGNHYSAARGAQRVAGTLCLPCDAASKEAMRPERPAVGVDSLGSPSGGG
jgi:hypothetical protein